jgi:hypothetical protein
MVGSRAVSVSPQRPPKTEGTLSSAAMSSTPFVPVGAVGIHSLFGSSVDGPTISFDFASAKTSVP